MNNVANLTLRSAEHIFDEIGLHDATLEFVTMNWAMAEASVSVVLLGGIGATLTFHQVKGVFLHRELPWGPSISINETRTLPNGQYEIYMQSGDTLRFNASSWSMRGSAVPNAA